MERAPQHDPWADTPHDGDVHRAQVLARAAATRGHFADLVTAARALLDDQPSPNAVHATARRLAATVNEVARDVIEGRS